jgi:hypothetical protein
LPGKDRFGPGKEGGRIAHRIADEIRKRERFLGLAWNKPEEPWSFEINRARQSGRHVRVWAGGSGADGQDEEGWGLTHMGFLI